jgi:hypothetical protein
MESAFIDAGIFAIVAMAFTLIVLVPLPRLHGRCIALVAPAL